ncbi:unnamed protein product [Polarella glacialis]|uniref:Uncharacterized protein n=1 Tax=Polarella glacialis TaxID=89957 RepID=A0A813FCR6_POLGL|nr:unnamed protein product [Polarella glacialis]CAE8642630.1 unnamed protein product [Polarella glacialis]
MSHANWMPVLVSSLLQPERLVDEILDPEETSPCVVVVVVVAFVLYVFVLLFLLLLLLYLLLLLLLLLKTDPGSITFKDILDSSVRGGSSGPCLGMVPSEVQPGDAPLSCCLVVVVVVVLLLLLLL